MGSSLDLGPGLRGVVASERDDNELTAMAACMTALRDLDVNAAARVAQYICDRHPFVAVRMDEASR